MQVVGEPVGGIRKHVHSIINGIDTALFSQSYAYSGTVQDARFLQEIGALRIQLHGELPLHIRKKPHFSDLVNLWKLVRYVKKNKVDILHGHGAKGGLYARLVAKFCGIKAVYTPHGGMVHNMFSKWEDKLYVAVEKWLAKKTDFFLFESKYTADNFQSKVVKLPLHRWMVNYNGIAEVNLDAVALRSRSVGYESNAADIFNIGVFGVLRVQKGQIFAIRAMPHLLISEDKRVVLHLFGDGPDRDELQNFVNGLGIVENVKFHGDVNDPEVHMFAMDVILIPSLFESFGYVAIEAMALQKLVITNKVGGLLEVIDEQTGILIEPENEMEVVNAIRSCLLRRNWIVQLASQGKAKVGNVFSLHNMIRNLENIYLRQKNNLGKAL
ncbi:MAG: glycosyltransferase family 4 protein [Nitrosopumilaceae archaeon]